MVRARGYPGSVVQLRRVVRTLRPEVTPTVYRRLVTLAAEEAQVDWGAFGTLRIGHGVRPLSGFVMVLSYSRAISALFTLDQTLESFLRGHVDAFHHGFLGVARTLVYENVPRNMFRVMCPPVICGAHAVREICTRGPRASRHITSHSEASQARRVWSSRHIGVRRGTSEEGSQRRSAASLARTVISA